jgi:hypothetical protein
MIDLYAPQGVLPVNALAALADRLLAAVLAEEGYAGSRFAASISWTYIHELPAGQPRVGNAPCAAPVWRVEITTPVGSLETAAKARLGGEIAQLVLGAEGVSHNEAAARRVWCLFRDVQSGNWLAGEDVATASGIRAAVAREGEQALKLTHAS